LQKKNCNANWHEAVVNEPVFRLDAACTEDLLVRRLRREGAPVLCCTSPATVTPNRGTKRVTWVRPRPGSPWSAPRKSRNCEYVPNLGATMATIFYENNILKNNYT